VGDVDDRGGDDSERGSELDALASDASAPERET